jgi:predicted class III extradiol MEMO1 family dioxygenase
MSDRQIGENDQPETPLPRLRPSIDMIEVGPEYGQDSVCLYDRQDPENGQVVISKAGLLLASLLDGTQTASAIRASFALRTGATLGAQEISAFVDQLDRANLLDSPRYRETRRRVAREFRARSTRPAVHAGGAYPGEPGALRSFLDARYTMAGGPGGRPGPVSHPSRRGLIAPHIDLHRGGHSYAWGYRALAESEPADLYVLLGTCHQPMRRPFAATALPYDTPFGPVTADQDFLDRLQQRAPYDLFEDELSHRREHALEFQAVYLRYLGHTGEGLTGEGQTGGAGSSSSGGPAKVVSILCVPPGRLPEGGTPRDNAATEEVIQALAETVAEDGRRVCFVAGADFAHVGPQFGDPVPVDRSFAEHVRAGDLAMLEHCAAGDADAFYRQVVQEAPGPGMAGDSLAVGGPRRICGLAPMYATLRLVDRRHGKVLHYDQWIDNGGAGSVTFGCVLFD